MGDAVTDAKMEAMSELSPHLPLAPLRWQGPAAIGSRPRFARSRSVRLSVQDSRLSRGKGGFDSRTERHQDLILFIFLAFCRKVEQTGEQIWFIHLPQERHLLLR